MFSDFKLPPLRDPRSRLSILDSYLPPFWPPARLRQNDAVTQNAVPFPETEKAITLSANSSEENLASKYQTTEVEFPEGGTKAWLVVFGSVRKFQELLICFFGHSRVSLLFSAVSPPETFRRGIETCEMSGYLLMMQC
jgi:hypothetical protein